MSERSPTGRIRRLVTGLCAAGLVTLVCVGAAELGLRLFAPIHLSGLQDAYRYDERTGFRVRPGIHVLHTTDHQQEIRANALGTVNFQDSFEGYEHMVFALGDSFTQGTGLPADASYPFQLDLALNRDGEGAYRKRVAVVNLGLAAFGGEQSAIVFDAYREQLGAPDGVLYLGYENDWNDDVLFRSGHAHRHVVHGSPRWGAFAPALMQLSRLQLVTRAKLALSGARRARMLDGAADGPAAGDAPSVAEREWPVIEALAEKSRAAGAFFVLSWADGESASYAWLRGRAAERGVAFADWYPRARSVADQIPALSMRNPHSGGHWRTWVNRIIADTYAQHVEQLLARRGARAADAAPR